MLVNRLNTRRFEGWSEVESDPLLEFLFTHSVRPELTCHFRWERGSVALWDNRCVQRSCQVVCKWKSGGDPGGSACPAPVAHYRATADTTTNSVADTMAKLLTQPGIGHWTPTYIAMRALREPDAFPVGDPGLLHAMRRHLARPSPALLQRRAERWRPWRACAAMFLWLDAAVNSTTIHRRSG